MPANGAKQEARRRRLRAVEELYLAGYCAKEIFDLIGSVYGVVYGTIRNDISAIREMWGEDLDHRSELEGKERYLAALRSTRRRAAKGWEEATDSGRVSIKGRDFKLVHQLDKEIARLSGVRLVSDERTIHVDIEKARGFMHEVMRIIFRHVTDPEQQEKIVAELEEWDEEAVAVMAAVAEQEAKE